MISSGPQPLSVPVLAGWVWCALAAVLWSLCGGPLPFLLAPMVAYALARALNWPLREWRHGRAWGQCLLGVALGLRFTEEVFEGLWSRWPVILLAAVLALLPAWLGYLAYRRWAGQTPLTACLCALPGGASEMALLAERHGASTSAVAWTQALRVTVVVSLVPWLLLGMGALAPPAADNTFGPLAGWRQIASAPWGPWVMCALWTGLLSLPTYGLHRRGWPNVWMMAPLLGTVVLMAFLPALQRAAGDVTVSMQLPPGALAFAQLCLGMTLASRLDRRAWRAAPRLTAVAVTVVLGSLALCGLLALLLTWCGPTVPQAWLTHGLSLAPGGMAEMALLARQSGAWLPEVIATHVMRLGLVLCLAPWLVRWAQRRRTPSSEGGALGV